MGYTTQFSGTLKFTKPLTAEEELFLSTICNDEMMHTDDLPNCIKPKNYRGYIQLVISQDKSGIEWDGNEKFYDAVDAVNTVIMTMQEKFPDFGLKGGLIAQGEEVGDVWKLLIKDGKATKEEIAIDMEE